MQSLCSYGCDSLSLLICWACTQHNMHTCTWNRERRMLAREIEKYFLYCLTWESRNQQQLNEAPEIIKKEKKEQHPSLREGKWQKWYLNLYNDCLQWLLPRKDNIPAAAEEKQPSSMIILSFEYLAAFFSWDLWECSPRKMVLRPLFFCTDKMHTTELFFAYKEVNKGTGWKKKKFWKYWSRKGSGLSHPKSKNKVDWPGWLAKQIQNSYW